MGGILVDNEGDILHMLGAEPPSHGCGLFYLLCSFFYKQEEFVCLCAFFVALFTYGTYATYLPLLFSLPTFRHSDPLLANIVQKR